jgi:glucose/arabinose dehydrogenase
MSRRVLQAAAVAALCAACQSQGSAQPEPSGTRPFKITPVAEFGTPWAMAFLTGSGRPLLDVALVTEKEGRLWLVDTKTGRRWPVAGVPAVKVGGQGGLGDVAVHPEFVVNRRVYLSFAEPGPSGTSGAALGHGTLDLTNRERPELRDFKVIWRQRPKVSGNGHFSHRIAFGPDGFLYLTSGDRQKMQPAQDFSGNLGKVLRLTHEGAPAPGNPYASQGGVAAEFWSIGHRNLLGIQFAPDGRLWEAEMGPQGGDEINLILPGRNYGWPRVSNGSHYGGGAIPDHKRGDGFEPPKVWWTPSISPGALLIYNGDKFPAWKGDALVGALSGEALIRVDIDGETARKADHWPMNARIRAVDEGPDGSIYLLEDEGRLLRLEPATAR